VSQAFDDQTPDAPPAAQARAKPAQGFASVPELASLSREQVRELFVLVTAVARKIAKSAGGADELVQQTFEKLMTTRRWDGQKPLEAHVIGVMKSLVSNQRRSEKRRDDGKPRRRDLAHEDFQREVSGEHTASPEERTLEHAEQESRDEEAEQELDELVASVAAHPLAPRVLQCRIDGLRKPREIAAKLGVSVDAVYRANDVLRRHLHALRRRGADDSSEGSEET
jgi:RNA polymerase sigma factor (sigma-70 family)